MKHKIKLSDQNFTPIVTKQFLQKETFLMIDFKQFNKPKKVSTIISIKEKSSRKMRQVKFNITPKQ